MSRSKSVKELPDPQTGLLPSDVALVKRTWLVLEKSARSLGVAVLLQFFDVRPEFKLKFDRFKHQTSSQLIDSAQFEAHACFVMHTLGSLVEALNDHELLTALCQDIGKNHQRMGVPKSAFWDLKEAIMAVIGETVGDRLPTGAAKAWDVALDLIFEQIGESLGSEGSKVKFG